MINRKLFTTFLIVITGFVYPAFSQDIAIGEWRDHLPYKEGVSVAATDTRVYCATPYSVFYYDIVDNYLSKLNSINGLNDIGIAKIGYNKVEDALVVAYSNTNIDIVKGNVIINMPDIFNSVAVTPEEKVINNLLFDGSYAYLSCGFGIVVIDLKKEEISETYYIGPDGSHLEVFDLALGDTHFYAATEAGVYSADASSPNLVNFETWKRDEKIPHHDETFNHIAYNGGVVFVNYYSEEYANDTIYFFQGSAWLSNPELFTTNDVYSMKTIDGELYITRLFDVSVFNENIEQTKLIWTYSGVSPRPKDVDINSYGTWMADRNNGLVWEETYDKYRLMYPNGPKDADVFNISVENNKVWVAPGGRDLGWGNIWNYAEAFAMIDNEWLSIDRTSSPNQPLDTMRDVVVMAVNPFNSNQVFGGTWHNGLIEFENGAYKQAYTPVNSSLGYKANQGPPICKTGGLAFDNTGNLWVTNSGAINILSVRMNDGSSLGNWKSFYLGSQSSGEDIGEVIVDSYGQKWILTRGHTVIVFNDNGTPENITDDQVKHLSGSQGNGALPGTKVFSIVEDNDGEIWLGTDEGVAVIYSPENVFSSYDFDAQQILIPRNDGTGLADILLEFETITSIAVDGDNKKWIGTDRSGIYLLSDDGLDEVHHFTVDNSPLFSNNITDIAINGEDGEVFIGTASGLISYKGTATDGGSSNSDVYAYPNPVKPGYNGPIAITGLVNNAYFKITDVSGNLVYSDRAEGGQAIWNGTNFNGQKVQTGVYIVFATNETGEETVMTKILFMN